VVLLRTLRRVHKLHGEVDALRRAIGAAQRHDVLFAQDRNRALDDKPRALIGIGHDAVAEDDALVWLEFDLQGHGRILVTPAHGSA